MNEPTPDPITAPMEHTSPEQRVAIAVLTQAIGEAKAGNKQAIAYVTVRNGGFDHWSDVAGLDGDWLREQTRKALHGHGPRVRTSKIWAG